MVFGLFKTLVWTVADRRQSYNWTGDQNCIRVSLLKLFNVFLIMPDLFGLLKNKVIDISNGRLRTYFSCLI